MPEVAPPGDAQLARLEALSAQLAGEDEAGRRAAYEALTTLDEDALPAIRARIVALARSRPPRNWVDDLIHRFYRRSGRTDSDPGDLAIGALAELGEPHPRQHEHARAVQLAETLFLWRSLQAMGTDEANRTALPIIGLDEGAWMPEARAWVRRDGPAVMAAVLVARSHSDRFVRSWARWGMEELGTEDPGRALPALEGDQLADVIRAYAQLRIQSAMRVIVSYVASERRRVRRAARWAMEQYGGNGIWILRTAYRNETGEHPPSEWGWRQISRELYARADARRLAPVHAALEAGQAARAAGDLETMRARFDEVLARAPELEDPTPVADGYAELAASALASAGPRDAARAYRRALRVAPNHPDAGRWRIELAFAEAEAHRSGGVLDLDAYDRVRALDPTHEGAGAIEATARPPRASASGAGRERFALGAAGLLGLLGLGLLWRRPAAVQPAEDFGYDTTLDAPIADDDTPHDATPGLLDEALQTAIGADFERVRFDEADATWAD